jgi:hypothetical protein
MTSFRTLLVTFSALGGMLMAVSACETAPPVQEMSDARQAIAVARESGAEQLATVELLEAVRYLKNAEQKLDAEEYAQARRAALQAKQRAVEAQRRTDRAREREDD